MPDHGPGARATWSMRLRAFVPAPIAVDARERLRVVLGAFVGILFMTGLTRLAAGPHVAGDWLLAPLGASAVLVFAAPSSPLAQPWAVVGGNVLSALAGMVSAALVPDAALAAALAISLAIAIMFALRCLHPPGGAIALLTVLAHNAGGHIPVDGVAVDSALMVAAALLYNTLTGRRYPHPQLAAETAPASAAARFQASDLDTVLARYNQVLDVSRDDLEALLLAAELEGMRRRIGDIRCRDVMTHAPYSVEFGSTLGEAWDLMKSRQVKALPVVDRARRIVGILTMADFLSAAALEQRGNLRDALRRLMRPDGLTHSEKPEVVGQIMTRSARVAGQDQHVMELLLIFSETGHHHIPIVDQDKRLVGIITQSDFVRFLHQGNYLTERPS